MSYDDPAFWLVVRHIDHLDAWEIHQSPLQGDQQVVDGGKDDDLGRRPPVTGLMVCMHNFNRTGYGNPTSTVSTDIR